MYPFKKGLTIHALAKNSPTKLKEIVKSFAEYRKKFKILIIDDNKIQIAETLKALEYVVSEELDIKSTAEVDRYDLILCDKNGVGKLLGASSEGVFLAKKIKERYPFKPVILYSSAPFSLDDFEAIRCLDDVISDAPDVDTFSSYVDDQIKKLLDPVAQWQKLHVELAKKGLSAREIAMLESEYVAQVSGEKKFVIPKRIIKNEAYALVRELLISFTAQSIFSLLGA